jgi:hypothetical protein
VAVVLGAAGRDSLGQVIAGPFALEGVRVDSIAPGLTATPTPKEINTSLWAHAPAKT